MTYKTSCTECRKNYLEDDRDPPCDEKGNCPINSVELLPENQMAVDIYGKIKSLGAEAVFKLADLTLDQVEAEELLNKMALIAGIINDWQAQQKGSNE